MYTSVLSIFFKNITVQSIKSVQLKYILIYLMAYDDLSQIDIDLS